MPNPEVERRIVEAAKKVFAVHGFFKAPTGMIAREAGISKGLLFWYFRSKDELIERIAREALPADIIKQCLDSSAEGKELLRCIAEKYMEKYSDPVNRNLLVHTMAAVNIYEDIKGMMENICSGLLREAAEKAYGEATKENIVRMRQFYGALLCYVLSRPKDLAPNEYIETLIKLNAPPTER